MWSNLIGVCDENGLNGRSMSGPAGGSMSSANQRRDAVIQLVSMISLVVQSAGSAYQRNPEDGDRVVKTVCELSRQALAELRVWPAEQPDCAAHAPLAAFVPCDRAGAAGYATMMAQTQKRAGGTTLPSGVTALFLTPRDLDVMRLIVRGLSNKEIAATLHLTEGTVKGYVSHLLSKLNVRSRTRAATVAIEQGWV